MLSGLRRHETPDAPDVVRLRTTWHGGKNRPHGKQRFVQLTVPVHIADQLPDEAKFKVSYDGDRLVYERIKLRGERV